jgi:hypothetical protein
MDTAKMAARLLKDFAHERRFEVRLENVDHLEAVAEHLRESGCEVNIDLRRKCIDVSCPPMVNAT